MMFDQDWISEENKERIGILIFVFCVIGLGLLIGQGLEWLFD
jgi:hypothetical protein